VARSVEFAFRGSRVLTAYARWQRTVERVVGIAPGAFRVNAIIDGISRR
jgi:hypothetical protein